MILKSKLWLNEFTMYREQKQGWRYEYLIFFDADVAILDTNSQNIDPWKKFEQFLVEYQPAVSTPDYVSLEPSGSFNFLVAAFLVLDSYTQQRNKSLVLILGRKLFVSVF